MNKKDDEWIDWIKVEMETPEGQYPSGMLTVSLVFFAMTLFVLCLIFGYAIGAIAIKLSGG